MRAGFDPDKDQLMSYQQLIGGGGYGNASTGAKVVVGLPYIRNFSSGVSGGPVIDWDMKTTLEGLWAAGDGIFGGNDHSHAATTGKYAGRKAAAYAKKAGDDAIYRKQVDVEKARVYGPLKRKDGVYWKELLAGINKVMQAHCGSIKRENLMKMGLTYLNDMQQAADDMLYAISPHDLGNALSILDVLTSARMIIHASIARKASSAILHFNRGEYPELDPPDWHKFVTLKMEDGNVKVGELPITYGAPYVENYEKYSKI